ncbi:MAG: hypothetical protein A2Z16_01450 [Chloroflexi bacterium RBG_16_54_18]|nr:MAG: hypothetical protein A2Z16_01450 [Chloroflexi bacterium RBG_16_54_18]
MSTWDEYPADYRKEEIAFISQAICAGDCAAVIGLSGSGKSNLLGFLAARVQFPPNCPERILVDCNRLPGAELEAFYHLVTVELAGNPGETADEYAGPLLDLEAALAARLAGGQKVCILLDRFDILMEQFWFRTVSNNLRALRDRCKYSLTYLVAARKPLDRESEMAELFFGHTLWLGPLSYPDALWSARRDTARLLSGAGKIKVGDLERMVEISGGYPSILRAVCEAFAAGTPLEENALKSSPAVARRIAEFWQDDPGGEALRLSRLSNHSWLGIKPRELRVANNDYYPEYDLSSLTAKESLLLRYLVANPGRVCEKDELVQAVWPEEVVFSRGIRDESLAQLVHRLRTKIEEEPENPKHILTSPGRGYIYRA